MLCAVSVFPNITLGISVTIARQEFNCLVIVCTPAVAHKEWICCTIMGIVHMADGNRHSIAIKANIIMNPHQITRSVIYIACAGTTCSTGGVIPIAFQTVTVAVGYIQYRIKPVITGVRAVIRRVVLSK